MKNGRMAVTFEFDEADWTVPVVFDNLVWLTDAEVLAAVRARVPSFDGTAPASEGITDFISATLQSVLESRGIPGRIRFTPHADLKTGKMRYLFGVTDPSPNVCALRITGASAVPEAELVQTVASVVGSDYSRSHLESVAKGTLLDKYRQRAHWAATFAPPVAALDAPGCSGVTVTLTVTEGVPYAWDRAEWVGAAALSTNELDALIPLKQGEPAGMLKIDQGLRSIRHAYGTKGHIAYAATYTPRLDESSRKAAFEIRINEGPQFRFGSVEFPGLADADVAMLRKRWQMEPGAVFDDSYPGKFYADVLRPALQRAGGRQMTTELRVDQKKLVVDVRYVLKSAR
jgi:outer membrane protein assembly factor BamA